MGWKYVMFENKIGELTVLFPVIFPDKLVHKDIVTKLKTVMPGWYHGGVTVVSAGKIEHLDIDGLGGDSETLGIASRGDDTKVIENYSYLHGIV